MQLFSQGAVFLAVYQTHPSAVLKDFFKRPLFFYLYGFKSERGTCVRFITFIENVIVRFKLLLLYAAQTVNKDFIICHCEIFSVELNPEVFISNFI